MRNIALVIAALFSISAFAITPEYPQNPDPDMTPGSLCHSPSQYRYPEQIPYCQRSVDGNLKRQIFANYRHAGFKLNLKNRDDYKIDHFIPLCAGGSNEEDNLWPQHVSIFTITDPMEELGCNVLKEGKITQAELVKMIIDAKHNLDLVPSVMAKLHSLN